MLKLRLLWRRWGLALALIAVGYFGFASNLDWWLFQLHSSRVTHEMSVVSTAMKASGLAQVSVGEVRYGQQVWPLLAVSRRVADAKANLCVFAGAHGNEPAGVYAALQLVADLSMSPSLFPGVNFLIMPVMNPAGWVHDLRRNGENKDIARHFVDDDTQETVQIKSLLNRQHCDALVDLHEDRLQSGVYLLSYGDEGAQATALALAKKIAASGVKLRWNIPGGIIHIPVKKFPEETLTTLSLYAQQHGTPQTFIVETPTELPLPQRRAVHRRVIEELAFRLGGGDAGTVGVGVGGLGVGGDGLHYPSPVDPLTKPPAMRPKAVAP